MIINQTINFPGTNPINNSASYFNGSDNAAEKRNQGTILDTMQLDSLGSTTDSPVREQQMVKSGMKNETDILALGKMGT